MRVLAKDPGLKSGIVLFDSDTQQIELSLIIPEGLRGIQTWWFIGYDPVEGFGVGTPGSKLVYDVLVVESFEAEEGTHGIDLTPVEIIGWLKSLGMPIVWQRRNQRGKGKLISVPVLKRAGLYPPRGELKEGHQVAALQHALRYLVSIRNKEVIQLLHPKE